MKKPAMDLFSGDGATGSDAGDINNIQINEEFARRYEHNKIREDLQRHDELKLKGLIDSEFNDEPEIDDSSGDDDDDDVIDDVTKSDAKFFEALNRIKKRDPELVNKDVKLFDDVEEDENDDVDINKKKKEKKKKKVYLKDVNANQLLEEGSEFNDEDDDVEIKDKRSYLDEVEANRNEFLKAVENEGGSDVEEEEFFKVKEKTKEEEDEGEYEKKLDEYFKDGAELDENEKFLKEYFRQKMWLGKDDDGNGGVDVDEIDVSDDDEEIWKQMDYERDRNFRHEEGVEDRVNVYARKVEDSVRKVENARKRQRESKKDRMAQAELERKEELKRLKNLKKKEMNEKIKKIREIAGIGEDGECVLDEHDLEEEFDPEKYDLKMKKTFDDKFYDAEDVDPAFGSDEEDGGEMEKPNFDEEDELLGLPKGWGDEFGPDDGFKAIREKILKKKVENGGLEEEEQNEEEAVVKEGKKKRKPKSSQLEEELVKKELEEYYKLEYEGNIGDLKTRFKYRPVKNSTYGLKANEILLVDEKELNQLIPMKKLATYRDDEFHVPYNKIKEQKQKIRSLLKGESSHGSDNGGKRLKNDVWKPVKQVAAVETEDAKSETQNEGEKKQSRKQKRKMRAQDLKLGPNRRMAYAMDVPKKKKKSKA